MGRFDLLRQHFACSPGVTSGHLWSPGCHRDGLHATETFGQTGPVSDGLQAGTRAQGRTLHIFFCHVTRILYLHVQVMYILCYKIHTILNIIIIAE